MLKPVGARTFQDYAMLVFLPYIKAQLARVTRVDIIWDIYIPDSLKFTAKENRGKGVRRRVAAANSIPGNWHEFLRVDKNKTELFNFLAHEVVENLSTEKEVFSTCGKHVLCSRVHQARSIDIKSQIYRRHSTNQSCTAAACKTSNIPEWPCMGSGPGPRSRSSFSRVLGMEQESDARMGTDVDVTPRSGRVLLRVVKMRL